MHPQVKSLVIHVILAAVAIGLAGGAHEQQLAPMIKYGLIGLAAGLSLTAILRVLFYIFST